MSETMLYRFFDEGDRLLYVGISSVGPGRWKEHEKNRPWWRDVAHATIEHYADRGIAMEAEQTAIRSEHPLHNKNHRVEIDGPRGGGSVKTYVFRNHRSKYEFTTPLYLYPEINISSIVGDLYDETDEYQFQYFVDHIRNEYPAYWEKDAAPIFWSVVGDSTFERAPFQNDRWEGDEDFLSWFTWPIDSTGEPIDWFTMSVQLGRRFPGFARALGWVPSPMQPSCPIRSIVESKQMKYSRRNGVR